MITVDTHIIIWEALVPEKLSKRASDAFKKSNEGDGILVCDISLWEISMLIQKGRVVIDASFVEFIDLLLQTRNYRVHEISPEIAYLATSLNLKNNLDPADRLIAATSVAAATDLVTADKNLRSSKILNTIW